MIPIVYRDIVLRQIVCTEVLALQSLPCLLVCLGLLDCLGLLHLLGVLEVRGVFVCLGSEISYGYL